MAINDAKLIQSLIRRYYKKEIREHSQDVSGDDDSSLSLAASRSIVKRICLYKDKDSIMLSMLILLIFWVEARGLNNEIIYGIPSQTLHESVIFKPGVAG